MGCEKEELDTANLEVANASVKSMNTVKITSTGMNFIAPDEIPSGWSTFSYMNKTDEPHFFLFIKVPDNITLEEYHSEVTVPFNNLLKTWRGENIPPEKTIIADWFWNKEVTYNAGGSGLLDGGKTAVTSIFLDTPGNYMIECYVKMPNGDFHSLVGMLDQITVTDEKSKLKEPEADVNISVDGSGLQMNDNINRPGLHTFSVDFTEATNADVHLVRIENPENFDRDSLKSWIFWGNNVGQPNEGLMTPTPEGLSFVGGSQELYKGGRTYFQAVLKPGTYALISEVSYYDQDNNILIDNFYEEFTVE